MPIFWFSWTNRQWNSQGDEPDGESAVQAQAPGRGSCRRRWDDQAATDRLVPLRSGAGPGRARRRTVTCHGKSDSTIMLPLSLSPSSKLSHLWVPAMPEMVKLDTITKSFDTVKAVDGVSFEIGTGEVVGLLGPNGAGKTTTMRLLTGYLEPDSGTVRIDGLDPVDDPIAVRRSIGYLPENNPLYDEMLTGEYLRFIAELRAMTGTERDQAIDRAAHETGVAEVLSRPIGELSKGYRQRTGLAAAVLTEPKVLILDEPTEGLDPNQRVDIRSLIREIGKKRTVLVSTHVLAEVQSTCDRVLVIAGGKLVADSSVADLMRTAAGTRTVTVEAKGKGVKKGLESIGGVASVRQDPVDSHHQRYVVSVDSDLDLRPEIFKYAASHEWELYELHEERASLEEVFRSLTKAVD